jgi:hypothetical protein
MDNRVAYCGIYCGACKIFIDTLHNDLDDLVKQTRIPEDYLGCEGCRSGRINLCCMNCGISRCCIKKKISTCNECEEFPCSVLIAFDSDQYPHHHGVIESLRKLSEVGPDEWLKMQNQRWSCKNCNTPFHWYQSTCEHCNSEVPGFNRLT